MRLPQRAIRLSAFWRSALVAPLFCAAAAATAQYPDKPVTLVVPFAAGAGIDQLGRLIAESLTRLTKTPFIVENRAGAGGGVGANSVVRAAPDGHTLLLASCPLVINPSLGYSTPFDSLKDLTAVSMLADGQFVLVASNTLNVRTLGDVIKLDKRDPGKLGFGTPGIATPGHMAGAILNYRAGTKLNHVPYKGSALSLTDLIGGQIPLGVYAETSILPHLQSTKLTMLAVTGRKRSALMPTVPTVGESGYPGYEVSCWYGVAAPAGTSSEIIATLQALIQRSLAEPELQKKLVDIGLTPRFEGSTAMAIEMRSDLVRWKKIISDAHITTD